MSVAALALQLLAGQAQPSTETSLLALLQQLLALLQQLLAPVLYALKRHSHPTKCPHLLHCTQAHLSELSIGRARSAEGSIVLPQHPSVV